MSLDLLPVARAAPWEATPPQSQCANCPVRESALCGSMNDQELRALNGLGRRRIIAAGQVVSWVGDQATAFANVVRGTLKVTAMTVDGREQIVGLLFPGDFVGQLFADRTDVTVTAIVETDLCSYPRPAFEALLDVFPASRAHAAQARPCLAQRRAGPACSRSAARRRRSASPASSRASPGAPGRAQADGTVQVAILGQPQRDADYLGLTIETVSRQITRLRAASIIAFADGNRDCRILNPARLEDMVNPV